MNPAIEQLKHRARLLHGQASQGDAAAIRRIYEVMRTPLPRIQRKHCLRALAVEHGFSGWPHAVRLLGGDPEPDYGTTLCPSACHGFTNRWFSRHDEAIASREALGGYTLAYRRQFLVVSEAYIRALGLQPNAPEWTALGHDWASRTDPDARARLYRDLFAARAG